MKAGEGGRVSGTWTHSPSSQTHRGNCITTCNATHSENNLNAGRPDITQLKHKENATLRRVGGAETQSRIKSLMQGPIRDITGTKALP